MKKALGILNSSFRMVARQDDRSHRNGELSVDFVVVVRFWCGVQLFAALSLVSSTLSSGWMADNVCLLWSNVSTVSVAHSEGGLDVDAGRGDHSTSNTAALLRYLPSLVSLGFVSLFLSCSA